MSTIFVPSIETRCPNYKPNQSMGNEKDSDDNLDFIVTFLNLPEAGSMKTQDEHENYTEKTSSPFVVYENDQLGPETIATITTATTMESQPEHQQFTQIQELNNHNNNDYNNYIDNNDNDPNDNNNNMQMQIVDETNMTTLPSTTPSTTPPIITTRTITTLESSTNATSTNATTTPSSLLPLHNTLSSIQNIVVGIVDDVIESNGIQNVAQNTTNNEDKDQQKQEQIPKENQNQNQKPEQEHEEVEGDDADKDVDDVDDDDDDDDDENELTNLTWLTELRNQSITWPSSINPTILDDNPDSSVAGGENCNAFEALDASSSSAGSRGLHQNGGHKQMTSTSSNRTSNAKNLSLSHDSKMQTSSSSAAKSGTAAGTAAQMKRPTPAERYQIFMDKVKSDLLEYEESSINYQTDATEKPPFNYSHIIGMAMLEKGRVTLQQICSWIEAKFAYFRVRKKWNNSIRHNLSLHHCFRKINRNKYEKGKGGYWELGVDPKKCDRKRIRNRKSTNSTHKNKTTNNNNNKNINNDVNMNKKVNSNNSINNNNNNSDSSLELQEATTAAATLTKITASLPRTVTPLLTTTTTTSHHLEMDIDVGLPTNALVQAEQMLLDDLDVQQDMDISSNQQHQQQQHHHHQHNHHQHHQQQQQHQHQQQHHQHQHQHLHQSHHQQLISADHQMQQEEAFIANVFANCIELDAVATTQEVVANGVVCSSNNSNNELPMTLTAAACMPQYQLGTVIISTSADDLASLDGSLISTLNSFICNNNVINSNNTSSNAFCSTQQHNEVLYREDEIPPASENIIVSSFLSDSLDPHSSSSFVSMPNQPNVIVEPIEPYYSVISASATTLVSTTGAGGGIIGTGSGGSEGGFRPYIDGIDEAFQYLRSMDNNRSEDLLDNLLDISVSDY